MVAQWLGAREEGLRAAAAEAVGAMVPLLSPSQLKQIAPKLLSGEGKPPHEASKACDKVPFTGRLLAGGEKRAYVVTIITVTG